MKSGITAAIIYESWAARHEGQTGQRLVGNIDMLTLGKPTGSSYVPLLAVPGSAGQDGVGNHPRHRLAVVRIRSLLRHDHQPTLVSCRLVMNLSFAIGSEPRPG
jgi:hypothetical protein